MNRLTSTTMLLTILAAGSAIAESAPFDYKYAFWGGAFFANVDTTIQWNGEGQDGTRIGLESALGVDDNEATFNGEFEWRFFDRHALRLRYFGLKRSGVQDAPVNINIGDVTIPIDTETATSFKAATYAAHYSWSFIKRENIMFDLGIGLSVQDIELELIAEDAAIDERGALTAPLPTVDLGFHWAITPRWILSAEGGWFDLKVDNVKGRITEARGGITWKPWDKWGFNLAYNYFEVRGDVTEEEGNYSGLIEYRFHGPMLGVIATF